MDVFSLWYVLPVAFLLDMIWGDPQFAHHPIRYMGNAITMLEPRFRKWAVVEGSSESERLVISGAFFAIFLILSAWGITWAIISIAGAMSPVLRAFVEILIIYYAISARCLEDAALEVYDALHAKDLKEAKKKLAMIVGRDVESLSEAGVARAAVETVAENLVDGVISPLFFAAIGGAPLAMAYKMVNTLDSMIGYKNERYADFGKAAARIDDIANFVPARVSVPVIAFAAQVLTRKGGDAINTAIHEGRNHSSPNAGYSEAAFAGTLSIRLGGPNYYHGTLVSKPYIGTAFGDVSIGHIRKACDLMLLSSFLWLAVLCVSRFIT